MASSIGSTVPIEGASGLSFPEKYEFVKELGKGTYSSVYLYKDSNGELFAIKQYEIRGKAEISCLENEGVDIGEYVKQLADKELRIGQLTDHPNIVKVKEVWHSGSKAYVMMEYIEGKPLASSEIDSDEARKKCTKQLLSALKHLLTGNVIVDDLWSENILISDTHHLTLIDLGGNALIGEDADMPIEHYVEMIEKMLSLIDQNNQRAIENCSPLISAIKEEAISYHHVKVLHQWLQSLEEQVEGAKVSFI